MEVFCWDHHQLQKGAQPSPVCKSVSSWGPSAGRGIQAWSRCLIKLSWIQPKAHYPWVNCDQKKLGLLSPEHCPLWLSFRSWLGLPKKQVASSVTSALWSYLSLEGLCSRDIWVTHLYLTILDGTHQIRAYFLFLVFSEPQNYCRRKMIDTFNGFTEEPSSLYPSTPIVMQ